MFYSQNLVRVESLDLIFGTDDCVGTNNDAVQNGQEDQDLNWEDDYFEDKFKSEEGVAVFLLELWYLLSKLSFLF